MGKIYECKMVKMHELAWCAKPIIYCINDKELLQDAFSISAGLTSKLVTCEIEKRGRCVEQFFNQVIDELPDNPIIKEFDVMFNPRYEIDVLKIVELACKRKEFSVVWPGKCINGKLIYAEDGYKDFISFKIDNYDVSCII